MRTAAPIDKKADFSELIVDAAERLLKTYGYQKMTMTDLAAEAGIGVGTTYLYFSSKSEVVLAVADRSHKIMLAKWVAIAESDLTCTDKIRAMLWIRISDKYERCREVLTKVPWSLFHRHGTEFLTDIKTADPDRIHSWRSAEISLLGKIIAEGIIMREFINVAPDATAGTLLSAMCGFSPTMLDLEDFSDPVGFKERVEQVITLLINGISISKIQGPVIDQENDKRLSLEVK